MPRLATEVLVVGSGAGGAVTAARLASSGRQVLVVEEGPWFDPDEHEPFSLPEMVAKYRHRGPQVALGNPAVALGEGRCVGGSTEVSGGLLHRPADYLAEEWQARYDSDGFGAGHLGHYAGQVEAELGVSTPPTAPPPAAVARERGATKLGCRNVEFAWG